MPDEPGIALEQPELFNETWRRVLAELNAESERACAVVAGALLDDLLGRLLESYLIERVDGTDELLSSENLNAPLGSFGAKIVAAYAVGLLRPGEREALRKIKRIRNRFAHDLELSFTDEQVSKLCDDIAQLCLTSRVGANLCSPRELFAASVAHLAGRFGERRWAVETFGLKGNFLSVFAMRARAGDGERNKGG